VTVFAPEYDEEGALIGEADVTPEDFGRIAAFAAKQVIAQRMREIQDEAVLGEFKGREGDIIAGVIQQGSNPKMIQVDLGTVEAMLTPEEQVPTEEYSHGKRMRFLVTKVVMVDPTFKAVRAFVPDFQLSLAIGNGGQNARLAARLTGAKIDIQPDSAMPAE